MRSLDAYRQVRQPVFPRFLRNRGVFGIDSTMAVSLPIQTILHHVKHCDGARERYIAWPLEFAVLDPMMRVHRMRRSTNISDRRATWIGLFATQFTTANEIRWGENNKSTYATLLREIELGLRIRWNFIRIEYIFLIGWLARR
jgi:hypothetical protein